MKGPGACKCEELNDVINLIEDTFRISEGYKPSMRLQFPLLLGKENLDNIRVIMEDGKPAAVVCFYMSSILVEGARIKTASVGSVCTDKNFRNRKYASMLLDDAEGLMKKKDVDLALVSGDRGLYLRSGYSKVKNSYELNIYPEKAGFKDFIEFNDNNIIDLACIYNRESVRFYRTIDEFNKLYCGSTVPWNNYTYKTYIVKDGDINCGYIVLKVINEDNPYGEVIEFSGDRRKVINSLKQIAYYYGLSHINLYFSYKDNIINLQEVKSKCNVIEMPGTLKILNFVHFMNSMLPYFNQYIDDDMMRNISFSISNNKYLIKIKDEVLVIDDINKLDNLVFSINGCEGLNLNDKPLIGEFIHNVFPIPFVWVDNLNFQ